MKVVVDASVAVKWLIGDQPGETHVDLAALLLGAITRGTIVAIQPPHWVAEAVAVVGRIRPERAIPAVALLTHSRISTRASRASYRHAAVLAATLDHHLFDTLYHAVAIEQAATLVTTDERYFDKARRRGSIELLAEFKV